MRELDGQQVPFRQVEDDPRRGSEAPIFGQRTHPHIGGLELRTQALRPLQQQGTVGGQLWRQRNGIAIGELRFRPSNATVQIQRSPYLPPKRGFHTPTFSRTSCLSRPFVPDKHQFGLKIDCPQGGGQRQPVWSPWLGP